MTAPLAELASSGVIGVHPGGVPSGPSMVHQTVTAEAIQVGLVRRTGRRAIPSGDCTSGPPSVYG